MSIESLEPSAPPVAAPQGVATPTGIVDPDSLRGIETFADLRSDELAWIAAHSERIVLAPGQLLLTIGQPADWMYIGLEGTVEIRREQLGSSAPAFVFHAGDVTGVLPYSRMKSFVGNGRAATHAVVARFPRTLFPELLRRVPSLAPRFVAALIDRVRDTTRREAQLERLLALGKLSAGIAHELNNPVAAILNTFGETGRRLRYRGELVIELVRCGASPEMLERLEALRQSPRASATSGDPIARSDDLDEMDAFLRRAGLAEPWRYAATFVDAGFDIAALESVIAELPNGARGAALKWLESGLALEALFTSAERAGARVAEIVDAVKGYTNRDRGRAMTDVDVREGLETTIALFRSRFHDRGVSLVRELETPLPRLRGYPGDLNQAWSHLIDNALDAVTPLGERGKVIVGAWPIEGAIRVEVRDNGAGIPVELQERIFEPFFTTKEPGKGTGLGLDIARRIITDLHGGELSVESRPGETRFIVRLPLTTVATLGV